MKHRYLGPLLSLSILGLPAYLSIEAQNPPPGLYQNNTPPIPWGGGCTSLKMDKTTLNATCLNYFGAEQITSLADAPQCVSDKHQIEDVNGSLRCVISSLPIGSGGQAYVGDVISISSDVKTATEETKVWRIDQPRVDIPSDFYTTIAFKPGDTIVITAGGCVQTGGSGATWKSYVYPTGDSAETYYSGMASVPGVIQYGRLAGIVGKTWTVGKPTDPSLEKQLYLTLGYQDEPGDYGDNGYYAHDNGNNNQCANVGPAWVEIKVVSKLSGGGTQAGVVWSPHSKPFDMVWDTNNEDYNGLPLNPKWAYQLDNSTLPNFANTCGPAITGGDTINITALADKCTSQGPTSELDPSAWAGLACQGVLDGHLNWYIATYTGWMDWEGWSGDWPQDGDYNLLLETASQEGFTALNWASPPNGEYGLGLEFKGGETTNNAGGPWWKQLQNGAENGGQPTPDQMFNDTVGENAGLYGVVTGQIGIDGVHGGYTESHPVYGIAIRTQANQVKDGVQETWVFFLRNFGNEGECGNDTLSWPSALNNTYFIQLPWWTGATDVKVVGDAQWWAWQDGDTKGWVERSSDPGWTLIKVQFPSGGQYGVDGQFTLEYTVPGYKPSEQKRTVPARKVEPEVDVNAIAARIADPTVRAKFITDVNALKPLSVTPPMKKVQMTVDTSMKAEAKTAGAASRGKGTKAVSSPDPVKKQSADAVQKLMNTYKSEMQPEPSPPKK